MPTRGCRSAAPLGPSARAVRAIVVLGVVLVVAGCADIRPRQPTDATPAPVQPTVNAPAAGLRYVALGDSYTIGTSVAEAERFPNQLDAQFPNLELVANLGVNGFTSADLIAVELPKLAALKPDVVSLLIGVNDVVQGVPISTYKDNLVVEIFPRLVEAVGKGRILVVTIPDYTVTPQGGAFGDPKQQSGAIRDFNLLMSQLAPANGVLVDIYDISLEAATDRTLVASDGLHPSGAQYARWVERIVPAMEMLLSR